MGKNQLRFYLLSLEFMSFIYKDLLKSNNSAFSMKLT